MVQVNLLFDYITSLLEKQPLEFDNKKCMYIKLLDNLKSLEKKHKSILAIQKWISEADMAEKHLGADIKKSDNILIYCKQPQSVESMELMTLQKRKTTVESKYKLFNALNNIDLNQRLLLRKNQREIEQVQLKFNDVNRALDSSSDAYNQLHTQNNTNTTKINEIFALMKFVENHLEHQINNLNLNVMELKTNIFDISKETLFQYNNKKKGCLSHKSDKDVMKFESSLLNAFTKLRKIIDSFNLTELLKPLKTLSLDDNLLNVNWTDFLTTYNFTRQKCMQNFLQNCKTVTDINTFVINLDDLEMKFNANLRNIIDRINNVKNERDVNTNILKVLDHELCELKKENNLLINSIDKSDKLNVKHIRELENKLVESNDQLIATIKNKEKLHDGLQHLDSLLSTTFQKYVNHINSEYQESLRNDEPLIKVSTLLENLKTAKNDYDEIHNKRKEIVMDQFNRKKSAMEAITKEKSQSFVNTRDKMLLYEDKMKTYEQFLMHLKDFDTSLENAKNDVLRNYSDLVFKNHGKSLEQLKDEEIEFTSSINTYNKELVELNKEYKNIENNPKYIKLQDMEAQIENLNETLQKVIRANASLEMELNKKKWNDM